MGEELETSGSFEKAADYFYRSLRKKSDNVKALLGLERTAPKVLDNKLKDVSYAYNSESYQTVIDKYDAATSYQSKVKRFGVNVDIPRPYIDKYNESKEILAERYYSSGKRKFDNGSYQSAITDLKKSLTYKSYYKDASSLISEAKDAKNLADAERYYKYGVSKLNSGNYRAAYKDFGTCLSYKSYYKDAKTLQNEALEKGIVRIGVFEFKNDTRVYGAHGTLYSYVVSNAVKNKSPFIKVIDRNNLDRLLREQKLGMSGIVDESSAAQAGKMLGLDYVVIGRLINVSKTGGTPTSEKVSCFELYPVKGSDGKSSLRGRPASFYLYEGSSTVTFEAKYQLISVETGEIISDDIISSSDNDHVKYATYRGDYTKLCAINPDHTVVMQLLAASSMIDQKLFTADKNLKSAEEMQTPIIKDLARQMANGICAKFE